jgi:hypothetical protein
MFQDALRSVHGCVACGVSKSISFDIQANNFARSNATRSSPETSTGIVPTSGTPFVATPVAHVVLTLEPNPTPKEIMHEAKAQLIEAVTHCFMAGAQMLNSTRRTLKLPYKRWTTSLTKKAFSMANWTRSGISKI